MPLALSFSLSPLFLFSLTHSCGLSFLVSSFALHSFILSLLSIFSFLCCAILIVSQSSRSSVTERSDSDWLTPCLRLFHLSPWHLSAYMRGSIPFLQYILLHSLNPSFDFSISFPFAYSFPPPLIDLCCFLSYFFPQFVSLFPFLLPFQQLCFSSHCLGVQCSPSSRQPSWLIPLLFFFFHSSTPHSISFQSIVHIWNGAFGCQSQRGWSVGGMHCLIYCLNNYLFQVRASGLDAPELLSLAVAASEVLPQCPKGLAFDTENVFINCNGTVEVGSLFIIFFILISTLFSFQ